MPKDKKSLKETHPNLVDEWDFNKNDLLIDYTRCKNHYSITRDKEKEKK